MFKFRPRKVSSNKNTGKEFTRDSIRALIGTPFHAGLVARYPRPALDMEDDIENPHKVKPPRPEISARQILEIQQGQHKSLISVETWQRLQQIRKGKHKTPTKNSRPRNERLLSGIAQCWECYQHDGRVAPLRGSTGGKNPTRYYRCATLHNRYIKKSKRETSVLVQPDTLTDDLLARHKRRCLNAEQMEDQLQSQIEKLVIPSNGMRTSWPII